MTFFKINDIDYSKFVSGLKISKKRTYNAQTNAAGNTVVDYINAKRTIEVEIIALEDCAGLKDLLVQADKFEVSLSYRDPKTGTMAEGVKCIIASNDIEYYTIQATNVRFDSFKLKFTEL